ncbi:MAG: energy transducer TonB [Massilia sp.]
MSRIKRLVRPDKQALNWKAALPVLGLAAALLVGCAQAPAKPEGTEPILRPLANFTSCAKPIWPREDLQAEHQGTVTLGFLISAEGTVLDSQVKKSSGYPGLDEAARLGIVKCHFHPATQAGKPVESWTQMQYVWTLQ